VSEPIRPETAEQAAELLAQMTERNLAQQEGARQWLHRM